MLVLSRPLFVIAGMWLAVVRPLANAQSGGFGLYEVATPNSGEAHAGRSAVASDASTAYHNPAGMTLLSGRHMLFGSQLVPLSMGFQASSGNHSAGAASTNLVPAAYFVQSLSHRVHLGFSLNQPFGAALEYPEHWAGRYFIQDIRLFVLDLRPSVAFRVNRKLSIGGGPSFQRASVSKRLAVPNLFDAGYLPDGSLKVSTHDWGIGGHFGVLFEMSRRTRVGATYRSKTNFQLRGSSTMTNLGPVMTSVVAGSFTETTPLHLPEGVNVSVYHRVTERLALLTDGGWTNWRHFGERTLKLPDGSSLFSDAHWRDTWRAGIGARYRFSSKLSLQTGTSYDSSPVSAWNRTPDIPVGRQHRLAAGVRYAVSRSLTVGGSYTHLALGTPEIRDLQNPLGGALSGRYSSARLPIVAFSLIVAAEE